MLCHKLPHLGADQPSSRTLRTRTPNQHGLCECFNCPYVLGATVKETPPNKALNHVFTGICHNWNPKIITIVTLFSLVTPMKISQQTSLFKSPNQIQLNSHFTIFWSVYFEFFLVTVTAGRLGTQPPWPGLVQGTVCLIGCLALVLLLHLSVDQSYLSSHPHIPNIPDHS